MTDPTTFLATSERVKVFLSLRTENTDPQEGAFWRETLIEGAIFREWLLNVGRREAYNRIAHLFCELMVRLRAVGLADDHACDLPITQAELGDAMGNSNVHVNRVLQQMRADGLIELKGDRLTVPDWETLKRAGDFDPTYLHLKQEQDAA